MLTLDLVGGEASVEKFCRGTKFATHVVSQGDGRTLTRHCGKVQDDSSEPMLGITDGSVCDLVADFNQAIETA